jgi:hypothetical protein
MAMRMKNMRTIDNPIRTYSELITLPTFEERYQYLRLSGRVGADTFGFDRYLNQRLYQRNSKWKDVRERVIIRDNGCDLGIEDRVIFDKVIVHHMNPVTIEDILQEKEWIFDPEFLICTCHRTHNAIHYGDENLLVKAPIERKPNDTCPWKQGL